MIDSNHPIRPVILTLIVVLSVVVGSIASAENATAATNTSIEPDNDNSDASNVTYTAQANVQLDNQDTLQHVDLHLAPADVSGVEEGDIRIYIDGSEYTDGLSQFSVSDGTVEFKLANSQSVSDNDPVRIVVTEVTNPSNDFTANVTLHDTGDTQWQKFGDMISIDTPPDISYADLSINDTTVNIGEDVTVSATVTNDGEQTGTYNASLVVDGAVQRFNSGTLDGNSTTETSFVTNFSSAKTYNVAVENLSSTEVTVTDPLGITGGYADPDTVSPGATIDNQRVYLTVTNISQDGNADAYYVEFPDVLASSLSINAVDANATTITANPVLVEGYDDDRTIETVTFETNGDREGNLNLNLTIDVSAEYPSGEQSYSIDARVADSSGEIITQSNIASVEADDTTPPAITNFSMRNPTGQEISASFDSGEQLINITVEITDRSGATVVTLTEGDFSEVNTDTGTWTYTAEYTVANDGHYTATLLTAADAGDNNGANNESETVTVNATSTTIISGSAAPNEVLPGETVDNQRIYVTVANVSQDGDTDTHYIEFPDALASGISVNFVSANATSITSSAELVEGYDDDGTTETVRFATSGDSGGTINLNLTVNTGVNYPSVERTYEIDAKTVDSSTSTSTKADVASITAVDSDTNQTAPTITDYAVSNPSGREIHIAFNSSAELTDIAVNITNNTGTAVAMLNESTFSARDQGATWYYEATYTVTADGSYTATLSIAEDANNTNGATEQSGSVLISTPDLHIIGGTADPSQVAPGTTVNNQVVSIVVANISADGDTDTYYVEFPDALASGLSPNFANANATSITSSIQQVDGYDGDGVDDTLRFSTSASGTGPISLTLSVDTSIDYPDTEARYGIDVRVNDSCLCHGTEVQSDVVTIQAQANDSQLQPPSFVSNATDPDGDGVFEDLNGDGSVTAADVTFAFNLVVNGQSDGTLDINGNDDGLTGADVTTLFNAVVSRSIP